jgi:MarR family transcriptional regulator, organic hydroperoxide resistance regulator
MFDNGAIKTEALLCFNLYAANLAMTRFYKSYLEPFGLTYPQFLVLLVLNRNDKQGVGDLSAQLQLDTGTLSPLLKRMETNRLIKRTRHTHDERRVIVELTGPGRKMAAEVTQIPQRMANLVSQNFHEVESSTLALRELRKVLGNIDPQLPA